MTSTRPSLRRRALVLVAALGLLAAACGSDDDSSSDDAATATDAPSGTTTGTEAASDGETVEIDWWHIQNNDPGMTDWQNMADAYMAEHPNVKINITVMENEAFKAALQTNLQAGDVPDLFQSWGGGGLREQVDAGLVQDITDASSGFIGDLTDGATEPVPGRRQAVRRAVQRRHGRPLVQPRPVRTGRDRRPARHLGRAARGRADLEGRGDHAARGRRRRQMAGPLLVLVPDGPPGRCRGDEPDRRGQQLRGSRRHRGRRASR